MPLWLQLALFVWNLVCAAVGGYTIAGWFFRWLAPHPMRKELLRESGQVKEPPPA